MAVVSSFSRCRRLIVALAIASTVASLPLAVRAQSARELDDRVRRLEQAVQTLAQRQNPKAMAPGTLEPATSPDADLSVRILKLEQLVEQLTGQIEESRFRTAQSANKLDQLANDVSLRLALLEQATGVSGAVAGGPPSPGMPPVAASATTTTARVMPRAEPAPRPMGEDGALSRPMTAQPTMSPPAPQPMSQPLQSMAQSAPMTNAANSAAVQNSSPGGFGAVRTDAQGRALPPDPNQLSAPPPAPAAPVGPPPVPSRAPNPGPVAASQLGVESNTPVSAALPDGTPKAQYDYAFEFLKKQDYGRAEAAFREFMKRYPKDALAGNAQYWLGETHYVRGDYQKSVIEFMNGYQNYPKSNKGPDNLLKLGMSLSHLGQTKEACTALSRLGKEYPDAGEQIRRSTQQERQKLKCT